MQYFRNKAASSADTRGGEMVQIIGANFGIWTERIEAVAYSGPGSPHVFNAVCTIVKPHEELSCITEPGAGAGLKWVVSVDGQTSTTPVTAYTPPTVTGLYVDTSRVVPGSTAQDHLNGVKDVHTDGGEVLMVCGDMFGPPELRVLTAITYGSGRASYTVPQEDIVHHNHSCASFVTKPGFGFDLQVSVTVAGQTSSPSSVTLSYARPRIAAVTPSEVGTTGGQTVTITGVTSCHVACCVLTLPIQANTSLYWTQV